jgi:glycosyltransferase involved in cell wall biosynthesis
VLPALLNELRQLEPDVVWFNLGLSIYGKSPWVNFLGHLAPMLTKTLGTPAVVTLHELFETVDLQALGVGNHRLMHWGGQLATRVILKANYICLPLRSYAEVLTRHYHAQRLIHIPLGTFNPPQFKPLSPNKRLLYFGGYAPFKGLEAFLEMYQTLKQADGAIELVVAGSDHPRFPGYFAQVRSAYAALPGVTWLQNVPEAQVPQLFEEARVVALPYTATTGASSVLLRAAAYGRPVVAYALPQLQALAADDDLEVAFAPQGNDRAFGELLCTLLNDPTGCERIGCRNVEAVQSRSIDLISQQYANVLQAAAHRQAVGPDGLGRFQISSFGD